MVDMLVKYCHLLMILVNGTGKAGYTRIRSMYKMQMSASVVVC